MLPLLPGRRVALVDDVISSGVSISAALRLLAKCDGAPVAIGAAMLQSDRWREPLAGVPAERIVAALRTPLFRRSASGSWTPMR
jgi:adenine/guanine phosphoribosyltransferase-like PRPP-binding protein